MCVRIYKITDQRSYAEAQVGKKKYSKKVCKKKLANNFWSIAWQFYPKYIHSPIQKQFYYLLSLSKFALTAKPHLPGLASAHITHKAP